MATIPLMLIVHRDSKFVDCFNKLSTQDHPVPLAYKFMDVAEIMETQQKKYEKIYKEKAESIFFGEPDEEGRRQMDLEKKALMEKELTEFAKTTMIELPDVTRDEISHAKMEPVELRVMTPWIK